MAIPTRDEIKPRVIDVIAKVSGFTADSIKEDQLFDDDLGMNDAMRGSLASGFTNIARGYNAHAAIAASACSKLETVKEAIDLVSKKAGAK